MHDDDQPTVSAQQDSWCDIAGRLRAELAKQIPLIGVMKHDEAKTLVETFETLYWLEHSSLLFDKKLALEQQRIFAD
jgi:hypothetical protein